MNDLKGATKIIGDDEDKIIDSNGKRRKYLEDPNAMLFEKDGIEVGDDEDELGEDDYYDDDDDMSENMGDGLD